MSKVEKHQDRVFYNLNMAHDNFKSEYYIDATHFVEKFQSKPAFSGTVKRLKKFNETTQFDDISFTKKNNKVQIKSERETSVELRKTQTEFYINTHRSDAISCDRYIKHENDKNEKKNIDTIFSTVYLNSKSWQTKGPKYKYVQKKVRSNPYYPDKSRETIPQQNNLLKLDSKAQNLTNKLSELEIIKQLPQKDYFNETTLSKILGVLEEIIEPSSKFTELMEWIVNTIKSYIFYNYNSLNSEQSVISEIESVQLKAILKSPQPNTITFHKIFEQLLAEFYTVKTNLTQNQKKLENSLTKKRQKIDNLKYELDEVKSQLNAQSENANKNAAKLNDKFSKKFETTKSDDSKNQDSSSIKQKENMRDFYNNYDSHIKNIEVVRADILDENTKLKEKVLELIEYKEKNEELETHNNEMNKDILIQKEIIDACQKSFKNITRQRNERIEQADKLWAGILALKSDNGEVLQKVQTGCHTQDLMKVKVMQKPDLLELFEYFEFDYKAFNIESNITIHQFQTLAVNRLAKSNNKGNVPVNIVKIEEKKNVVPIIKSQRNSAQSPSSRINGSRSPGNKFSQAPVQKIPEVKNRIQGLDTIEDVSPGDSPINKNIDNDDNFSFTSMTANPNQNASNIGLQMIEEFSKKNKEINNIQPVRNKSTFAPDGFNKFPVIGGNNPTKPRTSANKPNSEPFVKPDSLTTAKLAQEVSDKTPKNAMVFPDLVKSNAANRRKDNMMLGSSSQKIGKSVHSFRNKLIKPKKGNLTKNLDNFIDVDLTYLLEHIRAKIAKFITETEKLVKSLIDFISHILNVDLKNIDFKDK